MYSADGSPCIRRAPAGSPASQQVTSKGKEKPTMTLKKIASLIVLLVGLAGLASAQTALTQTTLSGAQSGPALYSGTSSTISNTVTLASCTGITAPILPGTPTSVIYIGREAEGVLTWNGSSCSGVVFRGYLGTQASPHVSGDMVLVSA